MAGVCKNRNSAFPLATCGFCDIGHVLRRKVRCTLSVQRCELHAAVGPSRVVPLNRHPHVENQIQTSEVLGATPILRYLLARYGTVMCADQLGEQLHLSPTAIRLAYFHGHGDRLPPPSLPGGKGRRWLTADVATWLAQQTATTPVAVPAPTAPPRRRPGRPRLTAKAHGFTSAQGAKAEPLREVAAAPMGGKPRDDQRAARDLLDDEAAGHPRSTGSGWKIGEVAP